MPVPLTTIEIDDGVATLTLDVPDGLADRAFVDALTGATAELAGRVDDVRAVVLASASEDLATGWADAVLADPSAIAAGAAAFESLASLPMPVVAAIVGRAHSAGLELALAVDIRVCGEGATFALPETGAGRLPFAGGTQRLARAVGRAQALRLLLTGDEIDAAEARRIGLVSRIVPDVDTLEAARVIARVIASRGPIATRLGKEAVHRGLELTLEQALRYELDLTVLLQTTTDRAEGVQAFAERRPPRFTGH